MVKHTQNNPSSDKGLKKTKIKLEMIADIDMLQMVEKGIRGGICHTLHQYEKTNNIIWMAIIKTKNHHI